VSLRVRHASGLEYLALVTALLQRARTGDPTGGIWEAADLHWWWRRDQHADPSAATFWLDGAAPVAAVVFTDWGDRWGCDLLGTPADLARHMSGLWSATLDGIEQRHTLTIEMAIRDDDADLIDRVAAIGFEAASESGVAIWMAATDRPEVSPPPERFELVARSEAPRRPHPMVKRNGEWVAERLAECSIYRPDLDLAVYTRDGEVAAYGLFWADPVTGVGLVEPMRTEDRYRRMGLGRSLLTEGLRRLAGAGAQRLKVSYEVGNVSSRSLYLSVGFLPGTCTRTHLLRAGSR
jgi:GNAT superfamily N-acetyltransferase